MAVPLTQVSDCSNEGSRFYVFMVPAMPRGLSVQLKYRAVSGHTRHRFVLLRRYAFYFLLLLPCGDVELNPGPSTAETLNQILDGQNEIKAKLQAIETSQNQSKAAIHELKSRMDSMKSAIAQLANLKEAMAACRKKTEDTHSIAKDLSAKVDDLTNRSRRCNLIFYDVADSESHELPTASEEKVQEIVSSLGLSSVKIEWARRLGRYQNNKPRPLIAIFSTYKDKQAILANTKKLNGSNISISRFLSGNAQEKKVSLGIQQKECF